MFELQTYLAKPPKLLDIEFGSNLEEIYKYQREKLYIAINDAENLRNLTEDKKFDPRYCPMKIILKYNGEYIVDFDKPASAGSGLWLDYLTCIEKLIEDKQTRTFYGIDYFIMGMESFGNNELKFFVTLDHNNEVILSVNLPEREFIKALLNELKRILSCMVNLGVFNRSRNMSEPVKILRRIERCESLLD
ncbi:MAG: hypothetical protein ACQEXQ_02410 [Bacillota bacterium]